PGLVSGPYRPLGSAVEAASTAAMALARRVGAVVRERSRPAWESLRSVTTPPARARPEQEFVEELGRPAGIPCPTTVTTANPAHESARRPPMNHIGGSRLSVATPDSGAGTRATGKP